MHNLIGEDAEDWRDILAQPDLCLHLYGKLEIRAGRKMGHVTRVFPEAAGRGLDGVRQPSQAEGEAFWPLGNEPQAASSSGSSSSALSPSTPARSARRLALSGGRFVRRAFQGKPRSSGLIPARPTEKSRVLEFCQVRQVAQRLEPELEQKLLRRHIGEGAPSFGLRGPAAISPSSRKPAIRSREISGRTSPKSPPG